MGAPFYFEYVQAEMFVDEIEIEVRAGNGGDGCAAFLHEKFRPKGGPSGGDGGRGGDIIIKVDLGLLTLQDFRGKRIFKAERGGNGEGKARHGAKGKDVIINVPPGTIVQDMESGEILADLDESSPMTTIAKGGEGGLGNIHFSTSVNQAPKKATGGKPGEIKKLRLEIRMIAEIGVVGLPSAGKSSLVSLVSSADPKKADYPFTTLSPKVGHIDLNQLYRITIADLPGLIEDAHEGKGLGFKFLKHIQRTRVLIHIIAWRDEFIKNPSEFINDRNIILNELKEFDSQLTIKPRFTVLNKIDLIDKSIDRDSAFKILESLLGGEKLYFMSITTHEGVEKLIDDTAKEVIKISGKGVEGLPVKFNLS